MKKRDIIQLVKESVEEMRAFYGSHDNFQPTGQRRNLSGLPGVMDEEGASWGLETRQLADSFTFEELEQLYNDNKITKEDLIGAKGYLQAWIDQHPTYLPQRDLNTSKRQAIRSYYLDPNRTTPKGGTQSSQFEMHDFEKKYGDKIKPDTFKNNSKLQPGKTVIYGGTRYKVLENNGYVLTLLSPSKKILKVNLNQFISQGAIKEKTMKKINEKTFGGKGAVDDMKKTPEFNTLQGPEKEDMIKQLQTGGTVSLEEDPNEISYEKAKEKGLDNPDKADISKDKDISDYELKRGMAIQKAMDQEKNEMHTNDVGKDDYVDDEGRMAKSQMYKTGKYAMKLHDMLDDMEQLPAWVQAKLTKASDYLSAVYHYLDYEFVRRDGNLMEHVDKYHKRARLMEGATQKLFALFNQGKTDSEVRAHYLQMQVDMPESFISKLRKNWEDLRKTKLDLTLADKEAEGFEKIQPAVTGMEGGEEGMEEEKTLASGLYNENNNTKK